MISSADRLEVAVQGAVLSCALQQPSRLAACAAHRTQRDGGYGCPKMIRLAVQIPLMTQQLLCSSVPET